MFVTKNDLLDVDRIAQEVSKKVGLKFSFRLLQKLKNVLEERLQAAGKNGLSEYKALLFSHTYEGKIEWESLIEQLVNTETHFFRDKGLVKTLKQTILPEIIERHHRDKKIKIWCAGCSTGQEVYTLAILMLAMRQELQGWDITLVGTDIHKQAIQTARKGVYKKSQGKFLEVAAKKEHFLEEGDVLRVQEHLKYFVRFKICNLITDNYYSIDSGLKDLDLIICRNVFIYFTEESIKLVLSKMINALSDQGIFIAGHGELLRIEHPLRLELMENAVIFRKDTYE